MAYVPGFDHDVFISYCHEDNLDAPQGGEGWVTRFERALMGYLKQNLPEKGELDVWRDPQLRTGSVLRKKLDSTVSRSAVLVCVMSARYFRSEYCVEELLTFWRSRHQGFEPSLEDEAGDKAQLRVFKALIQEIKLVEDAEKELREYPAEMKDAFAKEFFDATPEKSFSSLAWPRGEAHEDQRFGNRVERLAKDIAHVLTAMLRRIEAQSKPNAAADTPGRNGLGTEQNAPAVILTTKPLGTVYLAEVAGDDLDEERRLLQKDLEDQNIRVLPEEPLSNKRAEAEKEISQHLAEAKLAVHVFGEKYGKPLKDDKESSLPKLQYRLGRQHAREHAGFERLVWIKAKDPESVREFDSKQQREFLQEIQNEDNAKGTSPVDVQVTLLRKQIIESVLRRVSKPIRPFPPPSKRALIYVVGLPVDLRAKDANELIGYVKNHGHDVFGLPSNDADQGWQKQHEKFCQLSDGLVLFYGQASPDWITSKAVEASLLARGRHEKPLAGVVYEAPPPDKDEPQLGLQDFELIDGRRGFNEPGLRVFLARFGGLA